MPARWLEAMPLDHLLAHAAPRNPRRHDADGMRGSITRHGVVKNPTLDERTGLLVAGHGRLEELADRRAKGEAPPDGVEVADDGTWLAYVQRGWRSTDDAAAEAYVITSNHLGEGLWDDEMLAAMLGDYKDDPDWLTGTGYSEEEVVSFLASVYPDEPVALGDPDDVPPAPSEPVTKAGDLWLVGPHRVQCADATNAENIERLMAGSLAEMVFTDPPYGVGYDGGTKVTALLVGDENTDLYMPACAMAARFSSADAPLYLWHAGIKGIAAAAAAAAAGYEIRCEIVWNKNQAQFGALSAQYKQKHEPAYYCFKRGKVVNWCGPTNEVTVWDVDRASVNEFHPTQKPVALAQRAMRNHSASTVLDLFGGSGSTVIAAHLESRVAFVAELEPGYVDVILRQISGLRRRRPHPGVDRRAPRLPER